MASNPRLENVAQTASGSGFSNRTSVSSTGHFNGAPTIGSRSSSNVWNTSSSGLQSGIYDSTQPPSSSSSQTASIASYESKFQSSMSGSSHSVASSTLSASGSRIGIDLGSSTDLPLHEPAPMSLPVRIGPGPSNWSFSPGSVNLPPPSMPPNQLSGINSVSSSAPPTYAYDLGGSNIILPRGAIKPTAKVSATDTLASRSASTPGTIQGNSRTSSLGSLEVGSTKLDKRKPKKMNSSSLPTAPPSSSVASVPVADGNVAVAEFIVDRWPDALYQGWMKKRNKGKESTAKKRYLVVKTNGIEYYSDPMSTNPKGTIRIEDIAVQFNEGLRVFIKEKVWEFQAESERDLTRWHVVWRAVLTSINK